MACFQKPEANTYTYTSISTMFYKVGGYRPSSSSSSLPRPTRPTVDLADRRSCENKLVELIEEKRTLDAQFRELFDRELGGQGAQERTVRLSKPLQDLLGKLDAVKKHINTVQGKIQLWKAQDRQGFWG